MEKPQNPNQQEPAEEHLDLTDEQAGETEMNEGQEQPAEETQWAEKLARCEEDKLRLAAEMDNLRRRTARDVENAHKYALEKFMNDLLAVVDSLEKGLEALESGDNVLEQIREGTELTHRQLHQVLSKYGLEELDPMGEKFDPEHHEAMTMIPSEEHEPNTVQQVIRKGYRLNGRLVRPAQVIVTRKP